MKHGNKQERLQAARLWRSCRTGGRADLEKVRSVLRLLLDAEPRGWQGIVRCLADRLRQETRERTAAVSSAEPLSEALQAEVTAVLRRRHGADLQTAFTTDPALIGGLRVRVGSEVWDGSIHGRLAAMEQSM